MYFTSFADDFISDDTVVQVALSNTPLDNLHLVDQQLLYICCPYLGRSVALPVIFTGLYYANRDNLTLVTCDLKFDLWDNTTLVKTRPSFHCFFVVVTFFFFFPQTVFRYGLLFWVVIRVELSLPHYAATITVRFPEHKPVIRGTRLYSCKPQFSFNALCRSK